MSDRTLAYALVAASEAAYPRRGQPIVPRLLARWMASSGSLPAEVTDATKLDRLARPACRSLANQVVRRLSAAIDSLPAPVTARRLPHPAILAQTLLLDTRTRNILLRGWPERAPRRQWTVSAYLGIPGFGARPLLDVLTSLEASTLRKASKVGKTGGAGNSTETTRSTKTGRSKRLPTPEVVRAKTLDVVLERIERVQRSHRRENLRPASSSLAPDRFSDGVYLARTVELIIPELPLSEDAMRARLEAAGIAARTIEFARIAKVASRLALQSPFAVITLGGAKLLVRRRDISLAANAYAIAVRTTLNWGVTTTDAVSSQLSKVIDHGGDPDFVARVLSAVRGFEWIHQPAGWFWFRTRPSRLVDALAKIFAVTTELSLSRLYWALFKRHDERWRPPPTATGVVALALPGARVEGDKVTVPLRLDRLIYLSDHERSLVGVLESENRALSIHALRGLAAARGLSARTVLGFLRSSPLLEVLPDGRCCLIGAPAGGSGR